MKRLALLLALWLPLPAAALQHHLLIVSGIGGLDEYRQQFERNSERLYRAALKAGLDEERITLLSAAPLPDPPQPHRLSTKANIDAALAEIHATAEPGDRVFIFFIGHGNPRGDSAVFNLPGPDIGAAELDGMLARFRQQQLVIVNTASASGPFVQALGGANRVVISATSSGREYHAVIFGEHFIDALAGDGADRDKDERVSMLEAFEYARHEVRRVYDSDKRLLTEHALLDDNGDGVGSLEPGEFRADGMLARRIHLQPPWSPGSGASARLAELWQQKRTLEDSIDALKMRRDGLPRDSYYQQLELLLVDLALLTREIRAQGE